MSFRDLPVELVADILELALESHPTPCEVLTVNSVFHNIGQQIIYTRLNFHSTQQLSLFATPNDPPLYSPRTIDLKLSGGAADFEVFRLLEKVLRRCGGRQPEDSETDERVQVSLELLSLCLHSHTTDPHLRWVFHALSLTNPRSFSWTGPDPEHHFSTAIVPTATFHLFQAISTWTNIQHITLTNLSFPSEDSGLNCPPELNPPKPLLPPLPSLRTLCLGQAVMLRPIAVAAMVCLPGRDNLELVRLVDAYKESIWGARVRRSDIENAARALDTGGDNDPDAFVSRRQVVRCEAKTERIMGGDRVEGVTSLD